MNCYWPIYKKIESEVIDLSYSISFTDDQLSAYSVQIADCIVRCAVEIESISKNLYTRITGDANTDKLSFDSKCLKIINKNWHLDRKSLLITHPNMSFYYDNTLLPLYKAEVRGDKGAKWKCAYEALKHDRYGSIREGNIGNLLNALGALYILNLYYADKEITIDIVGIGAVNNSTEYDSMVFDTKDVSAINVDWKDSVGDESIIWNDNDDLNGSVYITKISDDDFKKHHFN